VKPREGVLKRPDGRGSAAGFSLVEVLVALIVISIGLLGIAKMQALALASTGTAKMRSLASIEAASLASTMQADRAYWSSIVAVSPTNFVVTVASNGTVNSTSDPTLDSTAPTTNCTSTATPCTPAQLVAQDLNDWAYALIGVLPNGAASIQCNSDATGKNPVGCTISLQWTENLVELNTATNSAAAAAASNAALQATAPTTYSLFVEP